MNWIQKNRSLLRRFPPGGRYLVGLSGGRDSVALLHLLLEGGYKKLIACHLNHQLRGSSSDADAKFAKRFAAKCDVDLEMGLADVRALARQKKISIEAAAREARYNFFAEVAKRRKTRTIFLAHHADDLVETFLINLVRGSGTSGLGAIREISKRKVDDVSLTIVRPLLAVWRDEIDDYARQHQLKFREDASNKDLAPLRNRIRRQIVPYLERTLGRNIRQTFWRAAMIAAEEENWIDDQLPNARGAELEVADLRELPAALQRREILKWLRGRNVANVGFDVVEQVRSLLEPAGRVAKVNLSQDRHVRRRAGKIFIQ
jgi:tRNA(Ile)-lysidine synthase